jgi:hypothetical protein
MKIRQAAVSGRFYPADKKSTDELIRQLILSELSKINYESAKYHIIGAVLPHAGYIYSGATAVHFFEILRKSGQVPDTFVIINPNHTGYGAEIALDTNEIWRVSNGEILIDTELAAETGFEFSESAHKNEHSAEVILPMLNYFINGNFKILPITMSRQNFENAQITAQKISAAAKKLKRNIIFLASSDFSHYVEPNFGKKTDLEVIEKITGFESENMIITVQKNRVSMCGYGPAASLIEYAKLNYMKPKSKLLRFGNSGERTGSGEVVDYATIIFYE